MPSAQPEPWRGASPQGGVGRYVPTTQVWPSGSNTANWWLPNAVSVNGTAILHSPEFKAQTVDLVRQSGKTVVEVARDLDLTESALREWVRQTDVDAGRRDGLTTDEKAELARLRRENRVLREEREILKKATAFFAKETR